MNEIKIEAKKRAKRKKKSDIIRLLLCGSRQWKDRRAIKKVLSQFDYRNVDFVMLGTSPGLEQLALAVCRQLKFNVLLMPPNVTRDSINALYFRNAFMFSLLHPTHVYAFHDGDLGEEERQDSQTKSTTQLLKLARVKKIEYKLITTKEKA